MAAASPRKPRRAKGRHRKPQKLGAADCAHWLRTGALGIGLAAAITNGHGVASATPDDSSTTSSPSSSAEDTPGQGSTTTSDDSEESPQRSHRKHDANRPSGAADSEQDTDATDEDAAGDDEEVPDDSGIEPASSANEEPASAPQPEAEADEPGDAAPSADTAPPAPPAEDVLPQDSGDDTTQSVSTTLETQKTVPDLSDATTTTPAGESTAPVEDFSATSAVFTALSVESSSQSTALNTVLDNLLKWLGLDSSGDGLLSGGLMESLWLTVRQNEYLQAAQRELEREKAQAEFSRTVGWIPVVGTVAHALSLVGNLAELATAITRADSADISDEIGDITRDLIGTVPVFGAPIAAHLYDTTVDAPTSRVTAATFAVAADADETPYEKTIATLREILRQLTGWPEPPGQFVTPANYALDQALDAHDDILDLIFANPTPTTEWIPDTMALVNLFFTSALPGYSFSDGLNTFADLLNRIVPPYQLEEGVPDATITEAQVASASVGALVKILDRLLLGDFDPEHWRDAAIEGGSAGFLNPSSILDMTFATTAEPNPFSLTAYIALVGVYERFRWVALNHIPVVTSVMQTGQSLLLVSGKVNVTDADGDPLVFTFTEPSKGIVTVGLDGTWRYLRTSDWSETDTDTFTITIDDSLGQVTDLGLGHPYAPYGHSVTVTVTVNYTGLPNNAPGAVFSIDSTDAMGVVRGSVTGLDIDGDTLTYTLVNPGTTGATSNSIYTGEGGIVQINNSTGQFVYIPKVSTDFFPALDFDTFGVLVSDGRGGTVTRTVTVASNLKPTTTTTSTSAYVENGKVDIPTDDVGLLTYTLGAGPSKGTVVVNGDGTYTYTRNPSTPSNVSTDDTFTIIGTDANGKTVTLPTISVSPPLITTVPATTVSGGTFIPRGMINGTAITAGSQSTTGTFSATDGNGAPLTVAGGIYTSARGGTVTVVSGGFLYTYTTFSDAFHKAAATNASAADKVDTVKINVTDSLGGVTEVTFSVPLRTENSGPSSDSSVGGADALGVVRGAVSGSDSDGDSFTYSLDNAGNPIGATTNSMYTNNGGIVSLNADGSFTYIPNRALSTSDSFNVLVSDGHGGTTTETVTVPLGTPSPVANINTSTPNVVTGRLNVPAGDSGLMTYSFGAGALKGSVTVNADGTFTYTRTASLGHTTSRPDSFTIIGTEVASGKTVTIATIDVTPTVPNVAPAGGAVTISSSSLSTGLTRNQSTTGTVGASDADGDTLTFTAGTISTTNGGTVTLAANGSFSYAISKALTSSYYHEAARVGASDAAVRDSFTVTVSDIFGGTTSFVVSVPIYATNDGPSQPTGGVFWPGLNDWTSVFSTDGNGDSLTYTITKPPQHGTATYNRLTQILGTSGAQSGDTIILTVTDGYYTVVDGVITTPASSSRTYTV